MTKAHPVDRYERQLLREETGTAEPRLQLRTSTRIDVGLWWRRRPVWLCVLDHELLLLAVGKRRYCERIAITDCRGTHYNPTSGELVIAPENTLRFPRLKMAPSQAMEIIPFLNNRPTSNIPTP